MKSLKKLRHLHLHGLTPYQRASCVQDRCVRAQFDSKRAPTAAPPPGPVLLTFQTPPTYTCGRREVGTLTESQKAHLRAGGTAEFYEALRGGQTTFHGPGQLTAYLVISLREHGFNTRSYVRFLEDTVIETCKHYSLETHTSEHPGVWIGSSPDDRKIASVGVHLRRHIASHGVGLNVSVDLGWFDRIVACGLVGKRATSIEHERKLLSQCRSEENALNLNLLLAQRTSAEKIGKSSHTPSMSVSIDDAAKALAKTIALRIPALDSHEVLEVTEETITG
ncbi:hypothetical protein ACLMJK_009071 [Lecanora helva]